MRQKITKSITASAVAAVISIGWALPSLARNESGFEDLITETDSSGYLVEGVEFIGHLRAHELYQQGVLFIDVRAPWRYDISHIRGAVGLDLKSQFNEERLALHAAKDQPVVFYCSDSTCYRSANASAMVLTPEPIMHSKYDEYTLEMGRLVEANYVGPRL